MEHKNLFVILGVLVLLGAGFYIYKLLFEGYTVKYDKIFAEAFSERPDVISDLKGGGSISGDYDVWLHFKLAGRCAELKNKQDFKENNTEKEIARRWFYAKEDPPNPNISPEQYKNLKLYQKISNTTMNLDKEWLLYNWRTDDQYYRKWGY